MTTRLIAFLLLFNVAYSQYSLPLIPQPRVMTIEKSEFVLNKNTIIQADSNMFEAQFLQQAIKQQTGLELRILPFTKKLNKISLSWLVNYRVPKGTYKINISNKDIVIWAETDEGFFYGVQTLLQLIPSQKSSKIQIHCLWIDDEPKYAWRGMHLDCARHFFPVSFVKKYIDYLAMYKFNTFHWHLTDDQGWRIEIKKYPKLTIEPFRHAPTSVSFEIGRAHV